LFFEFRGQWKFLTLALTTAFVDVSTSDHGSINVQFIATRPFAMKITRDVYMQPPSLVRELLRHVLVVSDGLKALEADYVDARNNAVSDLERAEPPHRTFLGLDFGVLIAHLHEAFQKEFAKVQSVCETTAVFLNAILERVERPAVIVPDFFVGFDEIDIDRLVFPCSFIVKELRTGFSAERLAEALRVFRSFETGQSTPVPHAVPDGLLLNVAWIGDVGVGSHFRAPTGWYELRDFTFPTRISCVSWQALWSACNRMLAQRAAAHPGRTDPPLRSLADMPTDLSWCTPVVLRELHRGNKRMPTVVCHISDSLVVFPTLLEHE
jgi:hypothetical protein